MTRWLVLAIGGALASWYVHDAWTIERVEPEHAELDPALRNPPLLQTPRPPLPPRPPPLGPVGTLPENLTTAWGRRDVPPPASLAGTHYHGVFELCFDTRGQVERLKRNVSTGDDDYDQRLATALWNWHIKPMMIANQPVEVCTVIDYEPK